ncbi:hypothetical protein A3770_20p85290 [Chloropicon primus]|nr:hypothetical protein A3770_20p85290 [Chloropicon primus]|eukprot:QDZ26011.1 hypothetical protein A3770_20p85290 [Chloropicon primus]
MQLVEKHAEKEAAFWNQEDLTVYDDARVFGSVFFTSEQLVKSLLLGKGDAGGGAVPAKVKTEPGEDPQGKQDMETGSGVKAEEGKKVEEAEEAMTKEEKAEEGDKGKDEDARAEVAHDPYLLADIHIMMLKGLHWRVRSPPCRMNWLEVLQKDVLSHWAEVSEMQFPSCFFQDNGEDEEEKGLPALYEEMEPMERLELLRFVCELCCEKHAAIVTRIENAVFHNLLPKKVKEAAAEMGPWDMPFEATIPGAGGKKVLVTEETEFVDDLRMNEAYAKDLYGRRYWLLNLYPEQGHCFMLRELPPGAVGNDESAKRSTRGSKGRKRESRVTEVPEISGHELICSSGEEFLHFVDKWATEDLFSEKFTTKFEASDVARSISEHKEQMHKLEMAQERLKSQLGVTNVMDTMYATTYDLAEDGSRRSRRKTKAVSYAEMDADFDYQIEDAIKNQEERRMSSRVQRSRGNIRSWSEDELSEDHGSKEGETGKSSDSGGSEYQQEEDDDEDDRESDEVSRQRASNSVVRVVHNTPQRPNAGGKPVSESEGVISHVRQNLSMAASVNSKVQHLLGGTFGKAENSDEAHEVLDDEVHVVSDEEPNMESDSEYQEESESELSDSSQGGVKNAGAPTVDADGWYRRK